MRDSGALRDLFPARRRDLCAFSGLPTGGVTMNLVERVKAILLTPKEEWQVIDTETGDANYLFTNYVAILAAIPAVCTFIGYVIGGWVGIGGALIFGILLYVIHCGGWYVAGLVIDALAPTFGGRNNLPAALKVAAYSATASWLSG